MRACIQVLEQAAQVGVAAAHLRIILQDAVDVVVGHALKRLDVGGIQLVVGDAAIVQHMHLNGQRQPDLMRIQAADAVAQDMRKHRYDAVRHIGRSAALAGFQIQRRIRRHIVRDIGDVHLQVPAVSDSLHADRIVKVLGIVTVNRDRRHIRQVRASGQITVRYGLRQRFSLVHDFLREFRDDVVIQQNGQDVDARIVLVADDAGDGDAQRIAVGDDLQQHLRAGDHGVFIRIDDLDAAFLQLLIVRHADQLPAVHRKRPDQMIVGVRQDADDAVFAGFGRRRLHEDGVAVQGIAQILRLDAQRRRARDVDESHAPLVDADAALDQARLFRAQEAVLAGAHDVVRRLQSRDRLVEAHEIRRLLHVQLLFQALDVVGSFFALADQIQYVLFQFF